MFKIAIDRNKTDIAANRASGYGLVPTGGGAPVSHLAAVQKSTL